MTATRASCFTSEYIEDDSGNKLVFFSLLRLQTIMEEKLEYDLHGSEQLGRHHLQH